MVAAMGRRAGADIETLPQIVELQTQLEHELHRAVAQCRAEGYTWAEIAERLKITRQAAFKRFADGIEA
jgi:DNA-directed RNA polymerase specialized sigma24 family protein